MGEKRLPVKVRSVIPDLSVSKAHDSTIHIARARPTLLRLQLLFRAALRDLGWSTADPSLSLSSHLLVIVFLALLTPRWAGRASAPPRLALAARTARR